MTLFLNMFVFRCGAVGGIPDVNSMIAVTAPLASSASAIATANVPTTNHILTIQSSPDSSTISLSIKDVHRGMIYPGNML